MPGPGSSFRRLMDNLGELTTIPSRVAKAAAADINGFIQEEFDEEQDPYGDAWAPDAPSTVKKKGHDRIMFETGETKDTTMARPTAGAGIEITSTQQAGYNQFPRGDVPARPVLPSRDELPEEWQDAIQKRVDQAMANRNR
jgi:hypothetical protein